MANYIAYDDKVAGSNLLATASNITYDNTDSGLTAGTVQEAIDEIADGSGSGGHIVENPSGTDMSQRANLQFTDAHIVDDSTNNRTKVEVTSMITESDFDDLTPTGNEYDGEYLVEGDGDGVFITADMIPYGTETVKSALDDLQPKGSASVEADGVKTYGVLLNELWALVDSSKVNSDSRLIVHNTSGDFVYHVERIQSGQIGFTKLRISGNSLYVENYWIRSTNSSIDNAEVTPSGTTFSTSTSQVPTSGITFTIYY